MKLLPVAPDSLTTQPAIVIARSLDPKPKTTVARLLYKMIALKSLLALAMANCAAAHFALSFPEWRADTLSEEGEEKYSQWTYPCAGVDYGAGNVTDWPLDGGAVKLALHHSWSYVFINLGLGENTTNFNVSLTPQFLNVTGRGQFCVEKLKLPEEVTNGTLATIQVVTVGESGSALYNCADIRFKTDAAGPTNCTSDMDYISVKDQSVNDTEGSAKSSNSTTSNDEKKNAGGAMGVNKVALGSVAGLAVAFAFGLGL